MTLITGAAGLVGSHLQRVLAAAGEAVLATDWRPQTRACRALLLLDVRERDAVAEMVARHRPQRILHLAAQSQPVRSWADPWTTMAVNVTGTVNLFEAVRALRRRDPGYDPVVVVASSSAVYGASLTPERMPVDEDAPLLPLHPYGVSKVAQDLLAFQYWRNDGIRAVRARIFNTTGPGKRGDVVSDFCRRVATLRARGGGTLAVGNLQARRAILDVRDLGRALLLLAAHGAPGEAYNISADAPVRIGDLPPMLARLAGVALTPLPDPALARPSDEAAICGRTDRLRAATGWAPEIALEQTVADVLAYELAHQPTPGAAP